MIKRSFYKEKIDIPNSDTSNSEKDKNTNTSIVNFLYEIGEKSASNYLEKRVIADSSTKYSDSLNKEYTQNERIKQKELIKISSINSGILERLDSIEKNLIDEQDTSIKQKTQSATPSLEIIRQENSVKDEKGLSWFDMLLGALLGVGMLAFLKGFKSLGPIKFAIRMMEMGWSWLKDKVMALATTVAKSIMKPLEEILQFLIEKISKIPGLEWVKEKYGKNTAKVPDPNKPDAKVTSTEAKVPDPNKPDAKVTSTEAKVPDPNKPDAKVTSTEAKINKTPDVDAGKLAKETEKATAKNITKISEKAAGKGLLKKIPFLGLGIAGAFAADRIGEGDYTGAGMEIASGLMSIVPVIGTAGSIGVDVALLARDIKRANEAIITKLDNEGIIDKGFWGDTTIEDWEKARKLSIEELKALAEYEDLDKSDREKIQSILYKKQLQQIQVPEAPEEFNDGVKIIFNDREILADTLLESDNKLQEFLMNNPFTDENSIKEETEVNGEKVTQIKFKDDELNAEYIKLKEQYDRDFKKYKESRDSQLKNLQGVEEIEGEYLTPEQVKNYQMSGMTMTDYSASTTKGAARSDVLGALSENYKNATLPTGDIVDRIKKNEAIGGKPNLQPYNDSKGLPTIGYGHLIKPGEEALMNGITKEQAEALFAKDFETHKNAAMRIPGFNEAPSKVQDALIDMTFNMGPAWYKEWPKLQEMMKSKNYAGIKDEILSSNYASQVKGRALVNAKIFEQAGSGANDTRLASTDTNVPAGTSTPEKPENINNLGKPDAVAQKQGQVQTVEDTNRALVNTGRNGSGSSSTTVVNNNITSAPKQEETYALMDIFPTYD